MNKARGSSTRPLPVCLQPVPACRHVFCVTVSQFITISLSLIVGKPIGPFVSAVPVQVLCLEQASRGPSERWRRKMQCMPCGAGVLATTKGGMFPCVERALRHGTGLLYGSSHARDCRQGQGGHENMDGLGRTLAHLAICSCKCSKHC